jgi:activator of 2-hydroxyglutaryl-CoA dehydratase
MTPTRNELLYLGIDIGSVSLAYVLLDQNQQIIQDSYLFHRGNILAVLQQCLKNIDLSKVCQAAYNHKSADFFNKGIMVNEQVALIEGVRH